MRSKLPQQKGQILMSVLVGIALFAILSGALFTLISSSYRLITYSSARITARHLAQEKIEYLRNLPFDSVGTVGGIPSGPIEQIEVVLRNDLPYTVTTSIVYIDDPFDGLAPTDLLPTDYKRVRVDVSWEGIVSSRSAPVTLITDISPQGIESLTGGGTLSILVFDANAQPVGQAAVHIVAPTTNPAVNLTLQTSNDGRIILPGAPTCTSCYEITVTKSGYSTDRTYSTSEVTNPDKPHQTILEGALTEVSFSIDVTGTLTIDTLSGSGESATTVGNVDFSLRGGKTIGTDSTDELVYKYNQTHTTNSSGTITLTGMEWDDYQVSVPESTGWDVAGTNPLTPLLLSPAETASIDVLLQSHSTHSLLITFTDTANNPIASVSAVLRNGGGDIVASASSGLEGNPNWGQVFFSSLQNAVYTLEAAISGFVNFNGSVNVNGTSEETIIMQSQ